jgi:hypothetical protein
MKEMFKNKRFHVLADEMTGNLRVVSMDNNVSVVISSGDGPGVNISVPEHLNWKPFGSSESRGVNISE